jgi:hypothetical protein
MSMPPITETLLPQASVVLAVLGESLAVLLVWIGATVAGAVAGTVWMRRRETRPASTQTTKRACPLFSERLAA